jgi:hypothetical protein
MSGTSQLERAVLWRAQSLDEIGHAMLAVFESEEELAAAMGLLRRGLLADASRGSEGLLSRLRITPRGREQLRQ